MYGKGTEPANFPWPATDRVQRDTRSLFGAACRFPAEQHRGTVDRFSYQIKHVDIINITQSDSTRAQTLELHIQNRVAEELKRLQAREEQTLKDLSDKLSSEEETPSDDKKAGDQLRSLGREAVQKEVTELRKKLESRKKIAEIGDLNKGIEKARAEVVSCLRANDRRPLDCWKEVEAFKLEVGKVEAAWVEKVVR